MAKGCSPFGWCMDPDTKEYGVHPPFFILACTTFQYHSSDLCHMSYSYAVVHVKLLPTGCLLLVGEKTQRGLWCQQNQNASILCGVAG